MTHDYTRKGGIVHAEIMLPDHAPRSFADRSILWNSVEQIEKARDSRTACAALDDTDGDMTEIYGEHLLSVSG